VTKVNTSSTLFHFYSLDCAC